MIASKAVWWDADRSKLVDEDDPEARFLAAAAGFPVPDGFVPVTRDGRPVTESIEVAEPEADEPEVKKATPAANKKAKPAANKGKG